MARPKYLIIIAGPTSVGKTSLSIQIASRFGAEIISSDSRQFYRELNIGTAKPDLEEQKGIVHHFVDSLSIHDNYSLGRFENEVIALLEEKYLTADIMIMTGGSGMHIRAITHGLDAFPPVDQSIREKFEMSHKKLGIEYLQNQLKSKDPDYAKIVDLSNHRRLIRALSVMEVSGQPFSSFLNQPDKKRIFQPIYIYLERDRAQLYDSINQRVDDMISSGLVEEARRFYAYKNLQALNTIGYTELFDYIDGNISLDRAIELIKRNSRRYAKRQMTWFRKEEYWNRFKIEDVSAIDNYIASRIGQ